MIRSIIGAFSLLTAIAPSAAAQATADSSRVYRGDEVDKPTVVARGSRAPRYPKDLKENGIDGCVLVRFVVDTTGQPDRSTTKLLAYRHEEFVRSVWDALPLMQFVPAEHRGTKVRQLVEMPFTFALDPRREWECKPEPPKQPPKPM